MNHLDTLFYAVLMLLLIFLAVGADSRWLVSTGDTEVELRLSGNTPYVTRLSAKGSAHNWVPKPFEEPLMRRVVVDGVDKTIRWTFCEARIRTKVGRRLVVTYTSSDPALTLRSIWQGRPGHGPVRHWIEIENLSGKVVTVTHQDSLSLRGLYSGGWADVWWIRRGAANASTQGGAFTVPLTHKLDLDLLSDSDDGASPVPWLAVQVGMEHGLYVGWEFSGLGRVRAAACDGGNSLDVNAGNLPDFRTDIDPGETFHVPAAFVGCYAGDIDDGSYCLHRFVIEKLRPPVPEGYPDPSINCAVYPDGGGHNATEASFMPVPRRLQKLGFEMFMPDAMWFPETGDWRWDPKRFPRGIEPIKEFVHASGMKLGLWCAWTNGGVSGRLDALSVRGPVGHPDWFNVDFAPDWKPGPFYGGRVCLACREAREWATTKTQWLVRHHKLDYLKHDCGPIVNHCDKSTHRHRYGVDVGYWATMGYYEVMDKLRKACPNVVLENCSGAGHIKDFGSVQHSHYIATADRLSNLPDRQSVYDSTFALPPMILQCYTYERAYGVKGDDPGPYFWRSAMMSA